MIHAETLRGNTKPNYVNINVCARLYSEDVYVII
jgi:hypothetical protein